ncbi:hypothetical protein CEXT_793021 [Caerostris extrusa]|uniref:Uncharacterized protein n=1 Tax=Caerostris extrusa TaxID=172846 RepID=A0AAV4VES4_CAEEX|nr:hypothetical protein CEXT_793021 [Caerostris extrusa]
MASILVWWERPLMVGESGYFQDNATGWTVPLKPNFVVGGSTESKAEPFKWTQKQQFLMDPNYATLAIILGDGAHSGAVRETANGRREWILSGQRNRAEGSLQT